MPNHLDIMIIGDAMVDVTVRALESVPGGANPSEIMISPGGLANIAVVAKGEGAKTGFLGRIGNDPFGDYYEEDLTSNGIVSLLLRSHLPTGICVNFISADGERTMYTSLGANSLLTSADLDEDVLGSAEMIFVSGFSMETADTAAEIMKIARRSKTMGKRVAVGGGASNLILKRPESFRRLVAECADYLLMNEEEAVAITGDTPERALEELASDCDYVIVTGGSRGSMAMIEGEMLHFKAPEVKPVDSTGAGDVFAGVVLAGIQGNRHRDEYIPRAHELASESVRNLGPRTGKPCTSNPK